MTPVTRQSLLDRVRETNAGDSWNEFVQIYDGLILSWLRKQGVSYNDAEDVRQEVMTAVCNEIANFQHNGRKGAFRSWLRIITSNRMQRLWQKRKARGEESNQLEMLATELEDDRSRLTLTWDQQHDLYLLESFLQQLSERFSPQNIQVFRRVGINQESAQEVADDLGMSIGTVRVAQHRIMQALKELGKGLLE